LRLRRKITIAFFLVSSAVAVLLAVFLYRFIDRQLELEVKDRLLDMAHIGAASVEVEPYQRLLAKLGPLDDGQVAAIEHGPDYKELYAHVRMLRAAEPSLVQFAYLVVPTADANHAKFVVDADVLDFEARAARGESLPAGGISHFNQDYDVSQIPELRRALADCTPQLEPEFVKDEEFGVRSISAYVPLTDDEGRVLRDPGGRCLGILGIDITDRKMRVALDKAGWLAIKISMLVIALALVVSITMGTLLTRSLLALSSTVKKFAAKDFTARTAVRSRDEVGQLGTSFNEMAATIQEHNERLEELVKQRTKELEAEKATSERLLLNVLPGPIADRLKAGESLIVDRFEHVSVLFADIVGFTALSAKKAPEELVGMLNDLFSVFDRLAEQHGLEKIKTIGDAYMVVAGIPTPIADSAVAIAHMALDMIEAVKPHDLALRVGIHTGTVVAGVIGKKKFIYDLWGDTVNTASRRESHGVPDRVHVTAATYAVLRGVFDLESRGPIEIKGKGLMTTYLLVGPKPGRTSIDQRESMPRWPTDDGGG
jgi:class 3 adenylate cyclase/HAMP domain-containing protein